MNRSTPCSLLVGALILAGCATTRTQEARHVFSFTFEGSEYQIVGAESAGGDAANLLILREDGHVLLRAVDLDQDGVIDTVLTGETSIARANEIYLFGIETARQRGRYSVHTPARYFEIARADGLYTLQTSLLDSGRARNRFEFRSIRSRAGYVAFDVDASGIIDGIQEGDVPLEEVQEAYEAVLQDAERAGRLERSNGRQMVTLVGRASA